MQAYQTWLGTQGTPVITGLSTLPCNTFQSKPLQKLCNTSETRRPWITKEKSSNTHIPKEQSAVRRCAAVLKVFPNPRTCTSLGARPPPPPVSQWIWQCWTPPTVCKRFNCQVWRNLGYLNRVNASCMGEIGQLVTESILPNVFPARSTADQ